MSKKSSLVTAMHLLLRSTLNIPYRARGLIKIQPISREDIFYPQPEMICVFYQLNVILMGW